jgi:hypothetical protein
MGGSNDPSNLIELSVEDHAEAHRILYEQHGRWQDRLAWMGLSGRIGKEEIIQERNRMARLGKPTWNKGLTGLSFPKKASSKENYRLANLGEKNPMYGKTPWTKIHGHTEETKRKMRVPKTMEARKNMSLAKLGKSQPKIQCPHCGKIGGKPIMHYRHMNNCISKVS